MSMGEVYRIDAYTRLPKQPSEEFMAWLMECLPELEGDRVFRVPHTDDVETWDLYVEEISEELRSELERLYEECAGHDVIVSR